MAPFAMEIMPALLLDFDGVIIRNKKISSYVAHQCTRLLADYGGLTMQRAKVLNDKLYPVYGHTSYILEKDLNIPCSIKAFNKAIYSSYINYDQVKKMISKDDREYAQEFRKIIRDAEIKENVFIFTNANDIWCMYILMQLDILDLIPRSNVLSSNVLKSLKPSKIAYDAAAFYVDCFAKHEAKNQIVFVDDQAKNIEPIQNDPKWNESFAYSGSDASLEFLKKHLQKLSR